MKTRLNRTVFLDFDGVLHHVEAAAIVYPDGCDFWIVEPAPGFPPLLCHAEILWQMIEPHDVQLVIHSSWRYSFSIDELRRFFPEPMRHRVVGITHDTLSRHESILFYADQHGLDNYLVLDDMPDEFPINWAQLIVCPEALGISDPGVQAKIKKWLGE